MLPDALRFDALEEESPPEGATDPAGAAIPLEVLPKEEYC